jgi:hypothetical protein
MLSFDCPRCGFCLKVPEALAGKSGACVKCRARITAPAPASTLPSASADEFSPVDLNTLVIDVDDRVRGLTPLTITVQGEDIRPGALDVPPEPVQVACGLLGTALLAVGLFAPIVTGRSAETIRLIQSDHGEGLIVLAMAVVAGVMCARKRFRWLYIPATVVVAILTAGAFLYHREFEEIAAKLAPLDGAHLLQWGWVVPAAGAVFIFAASALQPRN